jgi:hypothetical protein
MGFYRVAVLLRQYNTQIHISHKITSLKTKKQNKRKHKSAHKATQTVKDMRNVVFWDVRSYGSCKNPDDGGATFL